MFEETPLDPPERELESAFASLHPSRAPGAEKLLFEAGRRAERKRLRAWQGASALLALGLTMSWIIPAPAPRPGRPNLARIPAPPTHPAPPPSLAWATIEPSGASPYLIARDQLLRNGQLPAPAQAIAPPPRKPDYQRLLGLEPGDWSDSQSLRIRLRQLGDQL